jgi:class 3 adenylate cyclase/alpha-beta hydrolase superfamily lysophospholipase
MVGDGWPETQFAWVGEDRVAYQVFGEGDVDVLYMSSLGDALDMRWEWPPYADFLRRLGAQARVVMFDRRGSGSSDRPSGEPMPIWEQWAEDACAVLDATDSKRAVLLGVADGGMVAILFAASHPDRTRALMLAHSATVLTIQDAPATQEFLSQTWGTPTLVEFASPDASRDPAFLRWSARSTRLSSSPRDASSHFWIGTQMDVREALGSVHVPTLVLQREGCQVSSLDSGRYLSEHIPEATLAVLPGRDLYFFTEPAEPGLQRIEEFLHGLHVPSESDRALASILFTDFVGSTKHLAVLGDHAWRNLLDSHDAIARTVVEQHSGRLIKTTGDGILATFDGPGRAIRCSIALRDSLRPLGVEIRAGLHTGEVEIRGADIAGIAVHIAARVLDSATGGELLVSPAVPMLVAGAGFEFEDRGHHELKGVEGTWQLFAVTA